MGVRERYLEAQKKKQEKGNENTPSFGVKERSFARSLPSRLESLTKEGTDVYNTYKSRFFDENGEFINNYFLKGSLIVLEGRVESRQFDTKDGQKRTVVELICNQAHFCEKKKDTENNGFTAPSGFAPNGFTLITEPDNALPF